MRDGGPASRLLQRAKIGTLDRRNDQRAISGLFELQTPADLVKKLAHDLERMAKSPQDQWVGGAAAFGAIVPILYGWTEGAPYLFGALSIGVLGFLAHVAYIRYTEA